MTAIVYYGVPPSDEHGSGFVRFIDQDNPADKGRELPAKHVNAMRFEWGYIELNGRATKAMVPGAAPLALAICCHALASDDRGLALYQRFKLRVMDKWLRDQPWAISAEEVAAVCDRIEADELTPEQLRAIERERPAPESEGGRGVEREIVWDTDEAGQRIRPRGAE
jgi:hypothetical protein